MVRCSASVFEVKMDTSVQVFLDQGFVRHFFLCSCHSYSASWFPLGCKFRIIWDKEESWFKPWSKGTNFCNGIFF